MRLKEGKEVIIKNPRALVGKVIRQRPGDANLPEDERLYEIKIDENRFYRLQDLEPLEEDKSLRQYSREWLTQLEQWTEAGQRLVQNADDDAARRNFIDAGHALGFIVPK